MIHRVLAFTAAQGHGEIAAERHEVLAFGDDWFATAAEWTHSKADPTVSGAAEEEWMPASWRDEESLWRLLPNS